MLSLQNEQDQLVSYFRNGGMKLNLFYRLKIQIVLSLNWEFELNQNSHNPFIKFFFSSKMVTDKKF